MATQAPLSKLRIEDLTTSNEAMARCLQLAALAAKSDVPVVLLGETGTGKTLLAHAIHLRLKLLPARAGAIRKISRRSLSEIERIDLAYSAAARATGGVAGIDCDGIETRSVKRR